MTGMRVPYQQLSDAALEGVVDEYVTREGTEYGAEDHTLEEKRAQVRRQLERGEAAIVFDPESDSVSLVLERDLPAD